MPKYVLSFSKSGLIRFTSHLDMLRLFKRSFRRAGIDLKYSQGFNPHPKMGFAQPLSLGYLARRELLEFETESEYTKKQIISSMEPTLAQGLAIHEVGTVTGKKSLAALVDSADYTVVIPVSWYSADFPKVLKDYMTRDEISAMKWSKKKKKEIPVNIRPKIRSITAEGDEKHHLLLHMELDQGSQSNLNPELVVRTFLDLYGIRAERHEIIICRDALHFGIDEPVDWM